MLTLAPLSFEPEPSLSLDELRELGRRAVAEGRLEEALEIQDRALELARREGKQEQIDLGTCNRSTVAVALGDTEVIADLRPILLRNASSDTCYLAADCLSWAHEIGKEYKKGLFYARSAFHHAQRSGNRDWLASSHNQLGNCLIGDSHFEEAASEYRRALEILPEEPSIVRAGVVVNLGYCQMMLEDFASGFRFAFTGLRWYRRLGGRVYEAWPHLDLCYAYLEMSRIDRARTHAARALALAEETGDQSVLRNALFLMGETEKASGNFGRAHELFARLQRRFYPEYPQLLDVFSAVEMRKVVNLRA